MDRHSRFALSLVVSMVVIQFVGGYFVAPNPYSQFLRLGPFYAAAFLGSYWLAYRGGAARLGLEE